MPAVGAPVRDGVTLLPIPDAAVKLMPQRRNYLCALIVDQALIVDPQSRRIVDILNADPAPTLLRS